MVHITPGLHQQHQITVHAGREMQSPSHLELSSFSRRACQVLGRGIGARCRVTEPLTD